MSFKYKVLKKAVSYDLANFCFNYLKLKRDAVYFMYKNNIVNENPFLGTWNDSQFINTYSCYADFVMETLLLKLLPTVEKETKLKLIPTYSYTRLYKKGDELKKHKDRPSCEVSITLNLGGDNWDIYLEPSGKTNQKGIAVSLEVGDMLIYKGCELEHWREPFKGDICGQVFLHYNNINGEFKDQNKYDGRSMLGVPPTAR
tara:strand:+ start:1552 stop:2154 length:603 start_codon:yes stop_codon:yes gene_type:complete